MFLILSSEEVRGPGWDRHKLLRSVHPGAIKQGSKRLELLGSSVTYIMSWPLQAPQPSLPPLENRQRRAPVTGLLPPGWYGGSAPHESLIRSVRAMG